MLETAHWRSSCVIATDVPTPVKALSRDHYDTGHSLEAVDNDTGPQHHSSVKAYQLLIWTGSVDLLGIGRKQPTLPWEAVSAELLLFLLVVCPKTGQKKKGYQKKTNLL